MKKNLFTFVERNDSNKQFENHLCASVLAQIFGGGNHANSVTKVDDKLQFATHGQVVMHGTAHLIADAKATLHN